MKKVLCAVFAAVMAFCLLCGCSVIEESYLKDVVGGWTIKEPQDKTAITNLLMDNEFYPQELALVDTSLYLTKTITFTQDKTYIYARPVSSNKVQIKAFYDGVFHDLYEGREALKECYDIDISTLSEEDFLQFYAELYEAENYEALLTKLTDTAYDYDSFGTFETGTFEISSKILSLDTEGTDRDGTVSYKVNGDWLTLSFSDGTEHYTRIN